VFTQIIFYTVSLSRQLSKLMTEVHWNRMA